MAFVKYDPYGNKNPYDIFTTCPPEIQIWQELTSLRHLNPPFSIYGKQVISPWIDQAKIYFLDACKANWKSGGLLYYYSFLNLAKAFIVSRRSISASKLKSTSIYHGLSAKSQAISKIIDFEIEIHPPVTRNMHNIFAHLYQKITKQKWPFNNTITLKISDIADYCQLISYEIKQFYNIDPSLVHVQSLMRYVQNNVWFELLVPTTILAKVTSNLQAGSFSIVTSNNFQQIDKDDWFSAYSVTPIYLSNCTFLRFNITNYTPQNLTQKVNNIRKSVLNIFENYIIPESVTNHFKDHWCFVPCVNLYSKNIIWHPLLSDYLFAFTLSTLLRYHPHIFDKNAKDAFLAEAWHNQSAIIVLRYFLIEFSVNNLRID